MQVEVNEKFKFASVWLTNEEKNDAEILSSLQPVIEKYRAMKYKFVIYHSGTQNLVELTQGLLAHNKNLAKSGKDKAVDNQHEKKPSLHGKLESLKTQVAQQVKINGKRDKVTEEVL